MSSQPTPDSRPRGRPRKAPAEAESRRRLIRTGLVHLTEKGYSAVGIDQVLRDADVPKGSFYHYFRSKEDFGLQLVDAYHDYFAAKLDHWFLNETLAPVMRLKKFMRDAEAGMARHQFARGCLVGNLGQEMGALPEPFRARLSGVLEDWQRRTATCLGQARETGEIAPHHDPAALAAFFWIGWEGAVLRAKLDRSPEALRRFADGFITLIEG